MMKIRTISTLIVLIALGCSDDSVPPLLMELETDHFSLMLPIGWQLEVQQGYDSHVGYFYGRGTNSDRIYYDQGGIASFQTVDDLSPDDETISFERLSINGVPAVIEKSNAIHDPNANVYLKLYVGGEEDPSNQLTVIDPKNEKLIVAIFKTHRFL